MEKKIITQIIAILAIVIAIIIIIFYKKNIIENNLNENLQNGDISSEDVEIYSSEESLPVLIEFHSTSCPPCKTMEPIIESIKEKYDGKLEVKLIDVYKDFTLTDKYNIRVTPTQVFLDKDGKLMYKHEGVFYETEIISKLQEMGVN